VKAAQLPISPSRNLLRFADEIASSGNRLVLDAPCGYGRNAVALAALGCTVIGVDQDRKRLLILEQTKATYIAASASLGISGGNVVTVCADLNTRAWPFAPSSFSAIICVHFPVVHLISSFISSLQDGGHIYVETFGGHGENFRVLPKSGQLKELLSRDVEFKYYKERKVGPLASDSVAVTLFAQKRDAPH
jgi:SAM-dependent methyltransferase